MRSLMVSAVLLAVAVQPLDRATIDATVRGAADIFAAEYFDVPLSESVAAELRRRVEAGQYATAASSQELASRLTADLFALTRDKHVAVGIRAGKPGGGAVQQRNVPTTAGFRRTEILPGNIGLLDMAFFMRPVEHQDALAAAMKTLQPADALILDMRANGGGSPDTVALLISYMVEEAGLPIFDVRQRRGESARMYTTAEVPRELRNGWRPIYVLSSPKSFSGGEGLGFLLQDMKRAVVIGEITAGAANPGRGYPINDTFEITVPNGQLLTAVSRRNWEGTGVIPDVPVPAADALDVAHLRAIDDLLKSTPAGARRDELTATRSQLTNKK